MATYASLKNNISSGGGGVGSTSSRRLSSAMERTEQWLFSQEIPSDVIVQVGEAKFPLHKFILVAKSGYMRKIIMESTEADLSRIDLTDIPGGSEMFEKAAKFCYGVNFEINVHNVAPLHCAANYLEMTESYAQGNLVGRTDEFLAHVALKSFSGALAVLISCQQQQHHLLHVAEELNIVQRCLDVASYKACNEANFPSRSPANWWMEELAKLEVDLFKRLITSMKSRGAKTHTIAIALKTYTEKSLLRDLVRDHSSRLLVVDNDTGATTVTKTTTTTAKSDFNHHDDGGGAVMLRKQQRNILETIVSMLPSENGAFPVNFLCYLLRSATFLEASTKCEQDLEKRISAILEHVTVDDLLVLSFTMDGDKLFDLESVGRIISGFVDKEKSVAVFNGGANYYFIKDQASASSTTTMAMQKVAKLVDAYLGEIATYTELSISKFNGIANLVPKEARKVDDNLYRSIDIYLKAHPGLDEIQREKVCSVMDSLKLSYEARVHASKNKRLPVQIVLHALYYDQLKLRSNDLNNNNVDVDDHHHQTPSQDDAVSTRKQLLQADVSLKKENEELRSELLKMKLYISDHMHNNNSNNNTNTNTNTKTKKNSGNSNSNISSSSSSSRPTFFSSVSKKLGKLNPFRHGSKDTSNINDDQGGSLGVDLTKPKRRRFSIS